MNKKAAPVQPAIQVQGGRHRPLRMYQRTT